MELLVNENFGDSVHNAATQNEETELSTAIEGKPTDSMIQEISKVNRVSTQIAKFGELSNVSKQSCSFVRSDTFVSESGSGVLKETAKKTTEENRKNLTSSASMISTRNVSNSLKALSPSKAQENKQRPIAGNESKLNLNSALEEVSTATNENLDILETAQVSCSDDVTNVLERTETCVIKDKDSDVQKKASKLPRKVTASSTMSQLRSKSRQGNITAKSSIVSLASSKTESKDNTSMLLPHKLGSLPKYLRESSGHINSKPRAQTTFGDVSKARPTNLKNSPSLVSSRILEDDECTNEAASIHLKNEIKELKEKAVVEKNKMFKLKQKNDELKKQLEESDTKCFETSSSLKEKSENLSKAETINTRLTRNSKKLSSELEKKTKDLEELQKTHNEICRTLQEEKRISEELKKKLADEVTAKKSLNREKESSDVQLMSRKSEITISKEGTSSNKSLKTLSLDTVKCNFSDTADDISRLRQEVSNLKNSIENSKIEVQLLSKKLHSEQFKNVQSEKLLLLREEYIKNLHETDETLRRHLFLHAKEVEKLRVQVENEKSFEIATNEEQQSLYSTLSSQDLETKNLQVAIESKDSKLKKLQEKFDVAKPEDTSD